MAFMNQERKKLLAPGIKSVLKRYGMKGSIGVDHYSSLVVNLKSGPLDLIGNCNEVCEKRYSNGSCPSWSPHEGYMSINEYWFEEHFSGVFQAFVKELIDAMMACKEIQNHNRSDIQTDYFDVGWYIEINVGKWDKDYILEKEKEAA